MSFGRSLKVAESKKSIASDGGEAVEQREPRQQQEEEFKLL